MAVSGPQTPAASANVNTANFPTVSPSGTPAVQQSTRSFLNELARAVSAQPKSESSTQQNTGTASTVRSGVFSPASIGATAAAFGTTSASGGKAVAKKRSARKKTPATPTKLS